jgi:hypothetical protein
MRNRSSLNSNRSSLNSKPAADTKDWRQEDEYEWEGSRLSHIGSWEQTNDHMVGRGTRPSSRLARRGSWDSIVGDLGGRRKGGSELAVLRPASRLSRTGSWESQKSDEMGGRGTQASPQFSRASSSGSISRLSIEGIHQKGGGHLRGGGETGARPASRLSRTSSWESQASPMGSPFSRRGFVETVRSLSQMESPIYDPLDPVAGSVSPVKGLLVRHGCSWVRV